MIKEKKPKTMEYTVTNIFPVENESEISEIINKKISQLIKKDLSGKSCV